MTPAARARLTAVLLAAAALAGVGLLGIAAARPQATPSAREVCRAVDDLTDTLDLSTSTDQAALRARAARVAALVAARAEADGSEQSDKDLAVAGQLIAVLDDPMATRGDLLRVLEPVVKDCSPPPRGA